MDRNFEIEFGEEKTEDTGSVQLPMNFLTFGEIENDDVKVYIKQDIYKALEKLSASDTSKELGSILLGDYCQELGKTNVIISNFVEAKYTDASASTLTFTHETWDYIHSEHERLYPDKKIIGWQHTHPNYGIFLSNYDMFIQENFFNLPFQIAYVIDPIQNIRGFFQWKNGKIEKLKGYYVYDDVGKPIKIEQIKKEIVQPKRNSNKALISVVSILSVISLIMGISLISLYKDYQERIDKQNEIVSDFNEALDAQRDIIERQGAEITTLQSYFIDGILDSSDKTTAADLLSKLENHEIELENQEILLTELKSYIEQQQDNSSTDMPSQSENSIDFIMYTVEAGDSLSSICIKNGLDYLSNYRIIMALNGISDVNKIYIGQNLIIPSLD